MAKRAYLALRPFAQLFAALLQLAAAGAGCAKLARQPMAAVAGVQERLRVEDGRPNAARVPGVGGSGAPNEEISKPCVGIGTAEAFLACLAVDGHGVRNGHVSPFWVRRRMRNELRRSSWR